MLGWIVLSVCTSVTVVLANKAVFVPLSPRPPHPPLSSPRDPRTTCPEIPRCNLDLTPQFREQEHFRVSCATTLTSVHFLFSTVALSICAHTGFFEKKSMPLRQTLEARPSLDADDATRSLSTPTARCCLFTRRPVTYWLGSQL